MKRLNPESVTPSECKNPLHDTIEKILESVMEDSAFIQHEDTLRSFITQLEPIAQSDQDKLFLARLYRGLGIAVSLCTSQDKSPEAIDHYQKAIQIIESMEEKFNLDKLRLAEVKLRLGNIYLSQEDHKEFLLFEETDAQLAEKYREMAISIVKEITPKNEQEKEFFILVNVQIGKAFYKRGKYLEVMEYYKIAMASLTTITPKNEALTRRLLDLTEDIYGCWFMPTFLRGMPIGAGNVKEWLEYNEKSISLLEDLSKESETDRISLAFLFGHKGNLYTRLIDTNQESASRDAICSYEKAIAILTPISLVQHKKQYRLGCIQRSLGYAYKKGKQFQKAIQFYRESIASFKQETQGKLKSLARSHIVNLTDEIAETYVEAINHQQIASQHLDIKDAKEAFLQAIEQFFKQESKEYAALFCLYSTLEMISLNPIEKQIYHFASQVFNKRPDDFPNFFAPGFAPEQDYPQLVLAVLETSVFESPNLYRQLLAPMEFVAKKATSPDFPNNSMQNYLLNKESMAFFKSHIEKLKSAIEAPKLLTTVSHHPNAMIAIIEELNKLKHRLDLLENKNKELEKENKQLKEKNAVLEIEHLVKPIDDNHQIFSASFSASLSGMFSSSVSSSSASSSSVSPYPNNDDLTDNMLLNTKNPH